MEQPHSTYVEMALRSSGTTLEQFAPWKILLMREIQGWSAPGRISFFKKFNVKINFQLKINLILKYFEVQIYPTKP
jgi:hypothetical protein